MAQEKYTNIANIYLAETAANTFTTTQLTTGVAVFDRMAMLIHRIEYRLFGATIALLTAAADDISVGLTTSANLDDLLPAQAQVIDVMELRCAVGGTPGNMSYFETPFIHDFSGLPSGGLLIPGTSVYGAIKGTSLANPGNAYVKLFFSFMELKGDDYFELVQATQALT